LPVFVFEACKKPFSGQRNVKISILLNGPNIRILWFRNLLEFFQDLFIKTKIYPGVQNCLKEVYVRKLSRFLVKRKKKGWNHDFAKFWSQCKDTRLRLRNFSRVLQALFIRRKTYRDTERFERNPGCAIKMKLIPHTSKRAMLS